MRQPDSPCAVLCNATDVLLLRTSRLQQAVMGGHTCLLLRTHCQPPTLCIPASYLLRTRRHRLRCRQFRGDRLLMMVLLVQLLCCRVFFFWGRGGGMGFLGVLFPHVKARKE